MKRINQFFDEVEGFFLDKDQESFEELKEDMLEQIAIQLDEGKSEKEILEKLGDPEKMAAAFYEDQRLDKALKAEKDVVAVEDVKETYKRDKKRTRKRQLSKVGMLLIACLTIISAVIGIYLIGFSLYYGIKEQFLAFGPFTLGLFFLTLFTYSYLKLRKKPIVLKKSILATASVCLIISGVVYLNGQWFYQGQRYEKSYSIGEVIGKELDVNADYPIDISTVPISENEEARVEISGYMTETDRKNLVTIGEKEVSVRLGTKDLFQPMKKVKKTEMIFYLPAEESFANFDIHAYDGELNLSHQQADSFTFDIDRGEIRLTDIYAKKISLTSKSANLALNGFFAPVTINNQSGKSILKEGQGDLKIQAHSGLINLAGISGDKTTISNKSGKNVVIGSTVEELTINNKSGITVLENQTGKTTINSDSGKLILADLSGSLNLKNNSGQVIVNGSKPVAGNIQSTSGIVKWVQGDQTDMSFDLTTKTGKVVNNFNNNEESKNKISIKTDSGDIRIIKKND